MTRDRRDPPAPQADKAPGREARLAEALRANLHRRKAQARARAEGEAEDGSQGEPQGGRPEGSEGKD